MCRATYRMEEESGGKITPEKWRRHHAYFVLNRKHTNLVVNDTEIQPVFQRHCTVGFDSELEMMRECVSEEHYVSTLLAVRSSSLSLSMCVFVPP